MEDIGEARGERFLRPARGEAPRRAPRPAVAGRRNAAVLAAIALGALLALGRWAASAPELAVRDVAFAGAERVPPAVLDALRDGLLGSNLLLADLGAVEARLQAASPWVAAASVRRVPAGRIEVSVRERVPVARLGGEAMLLGAGGEALPAEPARPTDAGLPEVLAPAAGPARPPALARAARLLAMLAGGREPLLPRIATIDARDGEDLTMRLVDRDYAVRIGDGDFAAALNRFRNAEAVVAARYPGIEVVDLRFEGQVVVSPVRPAAPAEPSGA